MNAAELEAAATQILAVFSLYYTPATSRRREREREFALEDDF